MAAVSPAITTNSSDNSHAASVSATSISTSAASLNRMDGPPKTLRGLNKPKCIQCGNVARSRCPYQSCKSCCSKAQNPCHIHVLKASASFQDRTPTSSTLFDQQSTEVSPAVSSLRVASLRQLSNSFSQFNNVHSPLRSRKPLTRKEAAAINEWKFSKLKEYRDGNIEAENEAFDRYMMNISLLEEVFSMKSLLEGSNEDESSSLRPDDANLEDDTQKRILAQKLKLRSNPTRRENVRKRVQEIVEEGLKKLKKRGLTNGVNDLNDQNEVDKRTEKLQSQAERNSALNDLIDKLNKARTEEDMKLCMEMKAQLFNQETSSTQTDSKDVEASQEQNSKSDMEASQEQNSKSDMEPVRELDYFLQKPYTAVEIPQEDLNKVNEHFCTLEEIGNL